MQPCSQLSTRQPCTGPCTGPCRLPAAAPAWPPPIHRALCQPSANPSTCWIWQEPVGSGHVAVSALLEEATLAARGTKPVIEITRVPPKPKVDGGQTNGEGEGGGGGGQSADTEEGDEESAGSGGGGQADAAKKTARKSAKNSQQENEGFKVRRG